MDPTMISKATEGMKPSPKSDVEAQPLEIDELPDGRDLADIEYETSKTTDDGETNDVPAVEDNSQEEARGDDDIVTGAAFEKAEEYDHYLDDPNPWHEELRIPLFPAQIIGFRWMMDRHFVGGGLVADK